MKTLKSQWFYATPLVVICAAVPTVLIACGDQTAPANETPTTPVAVTNDPPTTPMAATNETPTTPMASTATTNSKDVAMSAGRVENMPGETIVATPRDGTRATGDATRKKNDSTASGQADATRKKADSTAGGQADATRKKNGATAAEKLDRRALETSLIGAIKAGNYRKAYVVCDQLGPSGRNAKKCVVAACRDRNVARARRYRARIASASAREELARLCKSFGIDLDRSR